MTIFFVQPKPFSDSIAYPLMWSYLWKPLTQLALQVPIVWLFHHLEKENSK